MTGEELERAIEFLLKSQANLEARIEQVNQNLSEQIAELKNGIAELRSVVGEQSNQLAGLTNHHDELARVQSHFVRVVTRTFEEQAEINRRREEDERRISRILNTVAETSRSLHEADQNRAGDIKSLTTACDILLEKVREHDETLAKHDETDRRLAKAVETMAETQSGLAESQHSMAETQRSMAETQRNLAETQRGLAENQSDTDERLNALINTVERYVSGRRGDEL